MGKLTIEGRASKKYDYDQMSVSVTFHSRMSTTSQALKNVMRQSELFLEKLDAAGIAPENVQIGKSNFPQKISCNQKFFLGFSRKSRYDIRGNRRIIKIFSQNFHFFLILCTCIMPVHPL